jgi:hypothetical protein
MRDESTATMTNRIGAARLFAGLDLLTDRERHADGLAVTCATLLTGQGGHDVTVGTHWASLGERRHVALVAEVSGLGEAEVRQLLGEVVDVDGQHELGLLVERRFSGPEALGPGLSEAVESQRGRSSGRAVVFPGSTEVTGTTTVGALTSTTSIDRVEVIGGTDPDLCISLLTRHFLRPRWTGGELVLHAQPAAGGALVPFEGPNPTACCAHHD